ncbi:putative bifunctional inhibitor/plant lipid transfer protein/seed storage helical [Helianthus anomalus]
MANLALFALTLTAIIAFFEVSAYRTTIITTTIEDNRVTRPVDGLDKPISHHDNGMIIVFDHLDNHQEQCRSQIIPTEQLNHCRMHLNQGIIFNKKINLVVNLHEQHLQECCSQLKNVSSTCQCDAIQQVFDEAREEGGLGNIQQIASKALRLPIECTLEVQDCLLAVPRV